MEQRQLGPLGSVSALALGGGGLGQVWGATTRDEAVATARAAANAGITLFDLAPLYGNGESERVIGEAFAGQLPPGVRVATKVMLGNPPAAGVHDTIVHSLNESLRLLKLDRVALLQLHSNLIPDGLVVDGDTERQHRIMTQMTTYARYARPVLERLREQGRIDAWGISGIGRPDCIIEAIADDPPPATVQCIANLLDSPGGLYRFDEPPRPRDIIAAAHARGVGVLGIRAVQAGALSDGFDRDVPDDYPEMADFRRAAPFRAVAAEVGENPAILAHRYALSMAGVGSVVLGVKNRSELEDCLAAEAVGPLDAGAMARIDAAVGPGDERP